MARDGELIQYFCHHTDTICHPNSSHVTTKLYGTSACGCNNNVYDLSERAIFTFPTVDVCSLAALDISAGPDRRASTIYLSLARTGPLDICRAIRFQIVQARTMTNHSLHFSRGRPPHISAVFAQSFCYSETPVWRESESGMSIKHTDVSV